LQRRLEQRQEPMRQLLEPERQVPVQVPELA